MDLTRRRPARKRPPKSSRERAAEIGRTAAYRERQEISARRAQFAADVCRAEAAGPQWNGRSSSRWQTFARLSNSRPLRRGDRVVHGKFGAGTIVVVEQARSALRIMFDDLAVGERCILSSFVVRG
jgi:hypothetical protein